MRVAAAIAVAVVGATMGIAQPSADELLLVSDDGVTFERGATWALFTDAGFVVPSDVVTDAVWLQNASDEAGRLQIRLDDFATDDPDLADGMTAWVSVPGYEDQAVALGDVRNGCVVLHSGLELGPGETAEVRASVAIDPALGERPGDAGDAGAGGTVDFVLRASITDPAVPDGSAPGDPCSDVVSPEPEPTPAPTEPPLPATGGSLELSTLGLGVLGAGVGIAMLLLARARRAHRS